jgi:hypothetical protein
MKKHGAWVSSFYHVLQFWGYVSQERFGKLGLSRFRGCRAADGLTRPAPFGRF